MRYPNDSIRSLKTAWYSKGNLMSFSAIGEIILIIW